IRMGSQRFPRHFAAGGRPGAYLRILAEGEVAAGDPVEVVHRPGHGLTVAEASRIYHDAQAAAPRLLQVPELAGTWRQWAERLVTGGPRTRGCRHADEGRGRGEEGDDRGEVVR